MGPIGHLLTQLHKVDANLNVSFYITQDHEMHINLLVTPWQYLRPQVEAIAKRHIFE